MRRTRRRTGPVTRLSLDALLAENPPWTGDHGDILDLYVFGAGLDMGAAEERLLEAAWPDLQFPARSRRREYPCPNYASYEVYAAGGSPLHAPGTCTCPTWWEEIAQRRGRQTRRRGA
jgi:hypothetical protein